MQTIIETLAQDSKESAIAAAIGDWQRDQVIKTAEGRRGKTIVRRRTALQVEYAVRLRQVVGGSPRESLSTGAGFHGTETAGDYLTMLSTGWRDGLRNAKGLDGLCSDSGVQIDLVKHVAGQFPIVPSYLAGVPDCMLSVERRTNEQRRSVTLIVDAAFNCTTSVKDCITYAQQVMALSAWLTEQQIACEIHAVIAVQQNGQRTIYTVPVRHFSTVLAPERVAAICHPSLLRRGYFALVECERIHRRDEYPNSVCAGAGYGSAQTASADELRQIFPDAGSVILLPKPGYGNPESAVENSLNLKIRHN